MTGSAATSSPAVTADEIVSLLGLVPHPTEGGHFVETYRSGEGVRSGERVAAVSLPERFGGRRALATAIYYLLRPGTISHLHRLASDEIFHFYIGDPIEMLNLHPDGSGCRLVIGTDLAAGMRPQVVVPAGVWQGARLVPGGRFALLGCTVSPGFEYADYTHGDRDALTAAYPVFRTEIADLTVPGA
ncbi:MAG: cupin domain-containing protein [Alphaproteobacteria bacterium]